MHDPYKTGRIVSLIFGLIVVCIGILFFIRTTHIVDIPVWTGFHTYWPVGLILAGVAFLFGLRSAGWILMGLTALVAIFVIIFPSMGECGSPRVLHQELALEKEVQSINASIHFGAGNVIIEGGDSFLFENNIETSDDKDPKLVYEKEGAVANIQVERQNACIFGDHKNESWHVKLAKLPGSLYLGYGAASAKINLTELPLDHLYIDSGATDTELVFGNAPTVVEIHTGASNVVMSFPKNASVKIIVDAGASSTHLEGFEKTNNTYVSPAYTEGNAIEVTINAGASDIRSSFY